MGTLAPESPVGFRTDFGLGVILNARNPSFFQIEQLQPPLFRATLRPSYLGLCHFIVENMGTSCRILKEI